MKHSTILFISTPSNAGDSVEMTLDDFLSVQDDYITHEDDGSFTISELSEDGVISSGLQAYLLLLIGMIIGILLIGDRRFTA